MKKGITLIALIITIIVMLILAGVSISLLTGENGVISNAQSSAISTRYAKYKEELGMSAFYDSGVYASGNKIKNYIPSIEKQDIDKFVIIKTKLFYIGTNDIELESAQKAGLEIGNSQDASNSGSTIKEIQSIINGVIELKNNFAVPVDDSQIEPTHEDNKDGLIGTRLFDRKGENFNNGTWNILIEYNSQNKEVERYGSGYYWLEKGKTYIINDESIEFKNDYVVNYAENEYIILSGRAVNWNAKTSLAVQGAVLNVDPMQLSDGQWINNATKKTYEEELADTSVNVNENFYNFYVKDSALGSIKDTGTQKTGDVKYDSESKALLLNLDEDNNPNGEGGYLKYIKEGSNFSNGFSFEFYMNSPRLRYNHVGETTKAVRLFL